MTRSNPDCVFHGSRGRQANLYIEAVKNFVDAVTFQEVMANTSKMTDMQIIKWLQPILETGAADSQF
jgi:hypothetical protein